MTVDHHAWYYIFRFVETRACASTIPIRCGRRSTTVAKGRHLGEFEQLVMLAVLRLGNEAYGMTVRRELQKTARRPVTIGSVYGTLERLEQKGFMSSRLGDPDPVRGGRARRFYQVEREGEVALHEARAAMERMWEGVEVATDGRT